MTKLNNGKVLLIKVSDNLSKEDYETFLPETELLINEFRKIRILFEMHDFHGWKAGALWEDIKFGLKHFSNIAQLVMVDTASGRKA